MTRQTRIIESTDPWPVPLLVASAGSDLEQAALLTRTFTRAPAELCRALALESFAPAEAKTYAAMPATEEAAVRAGYPVLA